MAAKYKYNIGYGELVIKDLKAEPSTYYEGQVLQAAEAGEAGVTVNDGTSQASIVGVCNQGETLPARSGLSGSGYTLANNGATLTGTTALGTIENLKVIVNSDAVYGVDYDQTGTIAYSANVDTQIDFVTGAGGYDATVAGYWLWAQDTGELNWVVATVENAGSAEFELVAGNDTTSATGILLLPSQNGSTCAVPINSDGLSIDGNVLNLPVAATNAINGVVLENRLESATYGSEILNPVVHNNQVRNPASRDLTKAVAYVNFASQLA
jgi:hypothetical protein